MNDNYIGSLIRSRRKQLSIPQKVLAKRLNTTGSYLSTIERGNKLPSLELLLKIFQELDAIIILKSTSPFD